MLRCGAIGSGAVWGRPEVGWCARWGSAIAFAEDEITLAGWLDQFAVTCLCRTITILSWCLPSLPSLPPTVVLVGVPPTAHCHCPRLQLGAVLSYLVLAFSYL